MYVKWDPEIAQLKRPKKRNLRIMFISQKQEGSNQIRAQYRVKTIIGVLVMVNHLKYQSRKYQGRRAGWYLRRAVDGFGPQKSNGVSRRGSRGRVV